MKGFVILNRVIDQEVSPIIINFDKVVALWPAINFHHTGEAKPINGTDIWTVSEVAENSLPWRVIESPTEIIRKLPSDWVFGDRAALSKALGEGERS